MKRGVMTLVFLAIVFAAVVMITQPRNITGQTVGEITSQKSLNEDIAKVNQNTAQLLGSDDVELRRNVCRKPDNEVVQSVNGCGFGLYMFMEPSIVEDWACYEIAPSGPWDGTTRCCGGTNANIDLLTIEDDFDRVDTYRSHEAYGTGTDCCLIEEEGSSGDQGNAQSDESRLNDLPYVQDENGDGIGEISCCQGVDTYDNTEKDCCRNEDGTNRLEDRPDNGCPACSCFANFGDPESCTTNAFGEECTLSNTVANCMNAINAMVCNRDCSYSAICDGHAHNPGSAHNSGDAFDVDCGAGGNGAGTEREIMEEIMAVCNIPPENDCQSNGYTGPCCTFEGHHVHCEF